MVSLKPTDDIVMACNPFFGFCSGYLAVTTTMCERFRLTSAVGSVMILTSPPVSDMPYCHRQSEFLPQNRISSSLDLLSCSGVTETINSSNKGGGNVLQIKRHYNPSGPIASGPTTESA